MRRAAWLLLFPALCAGYSVLTHEAIIDLSWAREIRPLLLQRFPNATRDELLQAHAYCYGGAIIQDMGYYPFGSRLFSDLTHYVRGGDFIINLLGEAQDLNEYAFALGSLAHYAADNHGHPAGVNPSTPLLYPEVRAKTGAVATYEDNPTAHIKTEFGFDVDQVAKGHYASQAFHDFIGFEVSKPLLERAFAKTYSIEMDSLFMSVDLALGTYRYSVKEMLPGLTKAAWELHKDELTHEQPGLSRRQYVFRMNRSAYEKKWGHTYHKPGFGARVLAFLLRLVPHVGPFKALSFRPPTRETEALFAQSFEATLKEYSADLQAVSRGDLRLDDLNFDTGKPVKRGEYWMADDAYAQLVDKLASGKFAHVDPVLRNHILRFYGDASAPPAGKDAKAQAKLAKELEALRQAPAGGVEPH